MDKRTQFHMKMTRINQTSPIKLGNLHCEVALIEWLLLFDDEVVVDDENPKNEVDSSDDVETSPINKLAVVFLGLNHKRNGQSGQKDDHVHHQKENDDESVEAASE